MNTTEVHQGSEAVVERPGQKLSAEFFESLQVSRRPKAIPIPIPIPIPWFTGSRFMIWKQDPSVGALGRRLTFIPLLVLNGPTDSRITSELAGTTPVHRNINGDFLFTANTPEADCAQAYAVSRETLTMYERTRNGAPIPWAWNQGGNTDRLTVFAYGFTGANAFYSRNQKSLRFGRFLPSGGGTEIFTCRSLDIVAHETGHAVLDGLKPGWLAAGNPPQTGGLHESFGDLTAIFLALSQLDQVEAFIAMTKADLHQKNFLQELAEQFGAALGRPMGLRNADNDLKLSQVSNEVHDISQVFTGGIYDVLADIFSFEKHRQRATRDPAHVLLEVAGHLRKLLLDAIVQAPATGATYSDVVNKMLTISHGQGDPVIYRTFIRNRFTFREVVVSPTPLTAMSMGKIDMENANFSEGEDVLNLQTALPDHPSLVAQQDRSGCCGTMQLPEYAVAEKILEANLKTLMQNDQQISDEMLMADEMKRLAKAFK